MAKESMRQLEECCTLLISKKITDRKTGRQGLLPLLRQCGSSLPETGDGLSWQSTIHAALEMIDLEIASSTSKKKRGGSSTKLREVKVVLSSLINVASQPRIPYLMAELDRVSLCESWGEVLTHIVLTLSNENSQDEFWTEYNSVLQKLVVTPSFAPYLTLLRMFAFEDLVELYAERLKLTGDPQTARTILLLLENAVPDLHVMYAPLVSTLQSLVDHFGTGDRSNIDYSLVSDVVLQSLFTLMQRSWHNDVLRVLDTAEQNIFPACNYLEKYCRDPQRAAYSRASATLSIVLLSVSLYASPIIQDDAKWWFQAEQVCDALLQHENSIRLRSYARHTDADKSWWLRARLLIARVHLHAKNARQPNSGDQARKRRKVREEELDSAMVVSLCENISSPGCECVLAEIGVLWELFQALSDCPAPDLECTCSGPDVVGVLLNTIDRTSIMQDDLRYRHECEIFDVFGAAARVQTCINCGFKESKQPNWENVIRVAAAAISGHPSAEVRDAAVRTVCSLLIHGAVSGEAFSSVQEQLWTSGRFYHELYSENTLRLVFMSCSRYNLLGYVKGEELLRAKLISWMLSVRPSNSSECEQLLAPVILALLDENYTDPPLSDLQDVTVIDERFRIRPLNEFHGDERGQVKLRKRIAGGLSGEEKEYLRHHVVVLFDKRGQELMNTAKPSKTLGVSKPALRTTLCSLIRHCQLLLSLSDCDYIVRLCVCSQKFLGYLSKIGSGLRQLEKDYEFLKDCLQCLLQLVREYERAKALDPIQDHLHETFDEIFLWCKSSLEVAVSESKKMDAMDDDEMDLDDMDVVSPSSDTAEIFVEILWALGGASNRKDETVLTLMEVMGSSSSPAVVVRCINALCCADSASVVTMANRLLWVVRQTGLSSQDVSQSNILYSFKQLASKVAESDDGAVAAIGGVFNSFVPNCGSRLSSPTRLALIECLYTYLRSTPRFSMLLNPLISRLLDPDFEVRVAAASALALLLRGVDDPIAVSQADIWPSIEELLGSGVAEYRCSAIFMFAKFACHVPHIEGICTVSILARGWIDPVLQPLSYLALRHISSWRGSPSVSQYLEMYLDDIVCEFANRGIDLLEHFPHELFSCSGVGQFLSEHAPVLVPQLLRLRRFDMVKRMAALMGTSEEALLEKHFGQIFGVCYPLYYTDTALAKEIWVQYWGSSKAKPVAELMQPHLSAIVCALLLYVRDDDEASARYPVQTITRVLAKIARGFKVGNCIVRLFTNHRVEAIHEIMLGFRRRWQVSYARKQFRQIAAGLTVLVDIIVGTNTDEKVPISASTFRAVLYGVFDFMDAEVALGGVTSNFVTDITAKACSLIHKLLVAASQNPSDSLLAAHVRPCVAHLTPLAQAGCAVALETMEMLLLEVGNTATQRTFMEEMCTMPSFPQQKAFERLSAAYEEHALPLKSGLENVLQCFVSDIPLVGPRHPKFTCQWLRSVKEFLFQHRQSLMDAESDVQDCIKALRWSILRQSQLNSEEMAMFAADSFSALCGIGSVWLSLGSDYVHVPVMYAGPHGRASLYASILRQLSLTVVDSSADVIEHSAKCILSIVRPSDSSTTFFEGSEGKAAKGLLTRTTLKYLKPFISSRSPKGSVPPPPVAFDAKDAVWSAEDFKTYEQWICSAAYHVTRSSPNQLMRACQHVARLQHTFAELVFAPALYSIVRESDSGVRLVTQAFQSLLCNTNALNGAARAGLLALDFIREEVQIVVRAAAEQPKKRRSVATKAPHFWDHENWPRVDLLDLAKCAMRCHAPLSAAMYVELWYEWSGGTLSSFHQYDDSFQSVSEGAARDEVFTVLLECYSCINEPDAMSGLRMLHRSINADSTILMLEHEGRWHDALGFYDSQMCGASSNGANGSEKERLGLINALGHLGFRHIRDVYVSFHATSSSADSRKPFSDAHAETMWRSFGQEARASLRRGESSSSTPLQRSISSSGASLAAVSSWHSSVPSDAGAISFDAHVLNILRVLRRCGMQSEPFQSAVRRARLDLAADMASTCTEDAQRMNKLLVRSWMLSDFGNIEQLRRGSDTTVFDADFDEIESIYCLQTVLLRNWGTVQELDAHLLEVARLARKDGRVQMASNCIAQRSVRDFVGHWEMCKAKWQCEQKNEAIVTAKCLITQLQSTVPFRSKLYCEILGQAGEWLALTNAESAHVIIHDYFEKALGECDAQQRSKIQFRLAKYCDGLYQNMRKIENSGEWESSMRLRRRKEKELAECQQIVQSKPELKRQIVQLKRQCDLDREEMARFEKDRSTYLRHAISSYTKVLRSSNTADTESVFRLCALWFENCDNEQPCKYLHKHILEIPSSKFIPLVYQIASRLGSSKVRHFSQTVNELLLNLAVEFPFMVVYQLIALTNTQRVQGGSDLEKTRAANAILSRLRTSNAQVRINGSMVPVPRCVRGMEELATAYNALAYHDVSVYRNARKLPPPLDVPRGIFSGDWSHIPVPTVQLHAADRHFITIQKLGSKFELVGGINLPKKFICMGSNGVRYKQLVKGNDDMRQDAVMQQMFHFVNGMFMRRRELGRRQLKIRTYCIVPLSPDSGILEWVPNTIPLSDYLVGPRLEPHLGAHVRYRPNDWPTLKCRQIMQEARSSEKLKHYEQICKHFKPVFHHFFLECFPEPGTWFERRLAYTRSVAASSIVGYVLGIGDRHLQNILVDQHTAELIHIDFGVAFEQGKMLQTPEIVPFRLTPDVVDGMGIIGCEGVFRRCCEATMLALREEHTSLLTIAEVFLHDPLFRWKLSPLRALQKQREQDEFVHSGADGSSSSGEGLMEGNTAAARALLRIRSKLQGVDSGELLSVAGQVNLLINDARDQSKLCKMFRGWSPWV